CRRPYFRRSSRCRAPTSRYARRRTPSCCRAGSPARSRWEARWRRGRHWPERLCRSAGAGLAVSWPSRFPSAALGAGDKTGGRETDALRGPVGGEGVGGLGDDRRAGRPVGVFLLEQPSDLTEAGRVLGHTLGVSAGDAKRPLVEGDVGEPGLAQDVAKIGRVAIRERAGRA